MTGGLRKAVPADLPGVCAMYRAVCRASALQRPNPVGWSEGRYPTDQVAAAALAQGTLYVWESQGKLAGTLVLNGDQPAEYAGALWEVSAPENQVLVVHTFMVHPDLAGQGIGRAILEAAHALGQGAGYRAVRLDTSELNLSAQRLYRGLGYRMCGLVDLHLGVPGYRWFHLYELPLEPPRDFTGKEDSR